MKKLILIGTLVMTIMLSVSAAYAFDLGGYTGPLFIKLSGYANGSTYGVSDNGTRWQDSPTNSIPGDGIENANGVGRVTGIYAGTDATNEIWHNGVGGQELVFRYYGVDDWKVDMASATNGRIQSVGGTFDFYVQPAGTAVMGTGTISTITGGTPFARFLANGGILAAEGDNTTTLVENVNIFPFGGGTVFGFGSGLLAQDNSWGTWAGNFDNNDWANGSDVSIGWTVSYNQNSNGFEFTIDDPARTRVVPEPASMALLGMGLLGLASLRKKKVA